MEEMLEIPVTAEREYKVAISTSWRDEINAILSKYERAVIIAPQSIVELFDIAHKLLFIVPEGEAQKDIETLARAWKFFGENNIGRKDAIIGIGGGATTDLAGFAAATWLRGVDWFAVPTSLAAMVDASVGGKTGINTTHGKNLVGSFNSPIRVIIDLEFLETLSDRDFAAGLAEVIKTGFISDEIILDLIFQHSTVPLARTIQEELIARSVAVKAKVVSEDFQESKLREVLNFGHTFGHAVEKLSNYSLRHGEAVAIGLHFALRLSVESCSLDPAIVDRYLALCHLLELPTRYQGDWQSLMELMRSDKKARSSKIRFVGIASIGTPVWLDSVDEALLKSVYERIME